MTGLEMSDEGMWTRHWRGTPADLSILDSRFTQEAYARLRGFMGAEDRTILEAGCGTGRLCVLLAQDFPNCHVIGLDMSMGALNIGMTLRRAVGAENVEYTCGDLFSLPHPDNCFDVVYNEGVIEHFGLEAPYTYKDAVQQMVRVTKPGGKVIVAVPNWFCLPHTAYKALLRFVGKEYRYGYEKSFKHKELRQLFREFGLTDLEMDGWCPSHGFYRLSRHSVVFEMLGKMADVADTGFTARHFGFEIILKGRKPH